MVIARSSNLLWKITILVMVGLCVNTAVALDGSGTQEDPWRIKSLDDFNDFAADANYWDDYTRLETDVNLAGRTYSTAVIAPDVDNANGYFDGTAFTGVFDGNDHKITDLTIDDGGADNDFLGLFGCIGEEGQVSNMGLEGGSISGFSFVGGLVGKNDGNVSNCYSTSDVSGVFEIGGLVGTNAGIVSNCYASGDVNGTGGDVGGLVGKNDGNVSNCYSTSDVSGVFETGGLVGTNAGIVSNCYSIGSVSGDWGVGGLVGDNAHTISNCYASGDVNGTGGDVGGLVGVGTNAESISNCYSTGAVSGSIGVGGLVGNNVDYGGYGNISNCYSTSDVSGVFQIGGLVGINAGIVSNCYSIGDVSGVFEVGGLVGWSGWKISNCFWDTDTQTHGVTESIGRIYGTVTNVEGLPTSQLHQQSTFTDWDFINVWNIGENQTYPYLRVYLAGDINKDGIVNFLDIAITANQWIQEK